MINQASQHSFIFVCVTINTRFNTIVLLLERIKLRHTYTPSKLMLI